MPFYMETSCNSSPFEYLQSSRTRSNEPSQSTSAIAPAEQASDNFVHLWSVTSDHRLVNSVPWEHGNRTAKKIISSNTKFMRAPVCSLHSFNFNKYSSDIANQGCKHYGHRHWKITEHFQTCVQTLRFKRVSNVVSNVCAHLENWLSFR